MSGVLYFLPYEEPGNMILLGLEDSRSTEGADEVRNIDCIGRLSHLEGVDD